MKAANLVLLVWIMFLLLMHIIQVNKAIKEPTVAHPPYDYLINIDNDMIYITSPGIDGGQTMHYEIAWDDSISIKDIIILDNN